MEYPKIITHCKSTYMRSSDSKLCEHQLTYKDELGALKFKGRFDNNRNKGETVLELPNTPKSGFKIINDHIIHSSYYTSFSSFYHIVHPNGFIIPVPDWFIPSLLLETTIVNGEIQEECVVMFNEHYPDVIPVTSKRFKDAKIIENAAKRKLINKRTLEPGYMVETYEGINGVYLGSYYMHHNGYDPGRYYIIKKGDTIFYKSNFKITKVTDKSSTLTKEECIDVINNPKYTHRGSHTGWGSNKGSRRYYFLTEKNKVPFNHILESIDDKKITKLHGDVNLYAIIGDNMFDVSKINGKYRVPSYQNARDKNTLECKYGTKPPSRFTGEYNFNDLLSKCDDIVAIKIIHPELDYVDTYYTA